jgi:hypothetical protein
VGGALLAQRSVSAAAKDPRPLLAPTVDGAAAFASRLTARGLDTLLPDAACLGVAGRAGQSSVAAPAVALRRAEHAHRPLAAAVAVVRTAGPAVTCERKVPDLLAVLAGQKERHSDEAERPKHAELVSEDRPK